MLLLMSAMSCNGSNYIDAPEIIETSETRNMGRAPNSADTADFIPGTETIYAKNVAFKMVHVQGGSFMMGAGPEQGGDEWNNEKPMHKVTLSHFAIAETEGLTPMVLRGCCKWRFVCIISMLRKTCAY